MSCEDNCKQNNQTKHGVVAEDSKLLKVTKQTEWEKDRRALLAWSDKKRSVKCLPLHHSALNDFA